MTSAIYAPDTDRLQTKTAYHAVSAAALLSIIEWLSGDECHALDEAGLVSGLGRRLQALGLPVDRLTLHLMTLHPEFIGRTIAWAPGEPVEIHDREHGARVAISNTPLRKVMETREPLVVDTRESVHGRWQHIDVFADRGLMQLVIAPLCNVDGPVSAAVFGTKRPGGFTASERQVIERIPAGAAQHQRTAHPSPGRAQPARYLYRPADGKPHPG